MEYTPVLETGARDELEGSSPSSGTSFMQYR